MDSITRSTKRIIDHSTGDDGITAPLPYIRRLGWLKTGRKLWLNVHVYIALSLGFIFALLGLTGSFNVFYFELEEIGLPEVHKEARAQPLPLNDIMQIVRAAHPQRQGTWNLHMPGYNRDYLWAEYPKPEETSDEFFAPLQIMIDPYTGRIVNETFWGRTVWSLVYEVHATLLMGKVDAEIAKVIFKIICFLGVFMFISALSGIYLWWPRAGKFRQAVTIKSGASPERLVFDLHKTAGFYSSIVLLILAFSGFAFGYREQIKSAVSCFSDVKAERFKTPAAVKSDYQGQTETISIDRAVAIADRIFPGAPVRWLATPDGKEGVYVIEKRQDGEASRRRPRSKVWIDQYSGKVLAFEDPNRFTAGETFLNVMWPLHSGEAFGFAGRVLWSIVGVMPLVLYVTGLIRWLQKRKAKKLKENRANPPALMGRGI
jgi:uncharacterized iron-regulated membrane protein